MELQTDIEIAQCPSCQGHKIIRWDDREYPCLLCDGTGQIELKTEKRQLETVRS